MQSKITSRSNEKIKYVLSLGKRSNRYSHRRFIIEGLRLLEEALRAGFAPALVLYTDEFLESPEGDALVTRLAGLGIPVDEVTSQVMSTMADTVTPQGVLAVVAFPELRPPKQATLVLIIDQVSTPGNLGTLLRSAEAAGADLVLLSENTTDPFSSKALRGGMGAQFRLPIRPEQSWDAIRTQVEGMRVYLAEAGGGLAYYGVDWKPPAALLVGNEARGPSDEAHALATASIEIPMRGQTESLNVGVAGSIMLFEAARQRRRRKH